MYEADGLPEVLQRHQYGGMILYGSNVKGTEQVTRLISDLQKNNGEIEATTNIPYFIALDQEGGIVTRIASGTRMTGNMALGATGENAAYNARVTGNIIGREVASIGANVDFAPVADVNCNPANPVIGTRSFSDDPDFVASLACNFNEGLAENNVIGCFKHFPGHGDTGTDSHLGVSTVYKTCEELESTEYVPFKSAIADGADMIMTAHITMPLVDDPVVRTLTIRPDEEVPDW